MKTHRLRAIGLLGNIYIGWYRTAVVLLIETIKASFDALGLAAVIVVRENPLRVQGHHAPVAFG